jgi:hypothetical protein
MAKQKQTEPVVETKKAEPRVSGSNIVKFQSNGIAPTLRQKGKVYEIPADTAQCLVDKGYGKVING